MTDPFALRNQLQRGVVFVGATLYMVLFAAQYLLNSAEATAMGDLVIAALALPSGAVVLKRSLSATPTDHVAAIAGLAFLAAGIGVGYEAAAGVSSLDPLLAMEALGTVGLVVGVGLYIYRTW